MTKTAPYSVMLDANVWVAERLLQSSIGSALLYTLARSNATIGLPEIVKLEVEHVLPEFAEKAVGIIRRETSLLRQLSGHQIVLAGPSALAIHEGIAERWKQIAGVIEPIPFTHDHAKSALARIINKVPPCGENNEQFRDCCIWDAAVTLAADRIVHMVSADAAFYDARKTANGLARALREEVEMKEIKLHIHPSLRDLLDALGDAPAAIDEISISAAILHSITPRAKEIATERSAFQLGAAGKPKIHGYATPTPSLVAVSFEVSFDLEPLVTDDDKERQQATLSLSGVCSYDPNHNSVSEIEVRNWSTYLRGYGGFSGSSQTHPSGRELRQFEPTHMRLIS